MKGNPFFRLVAAMLMSLILLTPAQAQHAPGKGGDGLTLKDLKTPGGFTLGAIYHFAVTGKKSAVAVAIAEYNGTKGFYSVKITKKGAVKSPRIIADTTESIAGADIVWFGQNGQPAPADAPAGMLVYFTVTRDPIYYSTLRGYALPLDANCNAAGGAVEFLDWQRPDDKEMDEVRISAAAGPRSVCVLASRRFWVQFQDVWYEGAGQESVCLELDLDGAPIGDMRDVPLPTAANTGNLRLGDSIWSGSAWIFLVTIDDYGVSKKKVFTVTIGSAAAPTLAASADPVVRLFIEDEQKAEFDIHGGLQFLPLRPGSTKAAAPGKTDLQYVFVQREERDGWTSRLDVTRTIQGLTSTGTKSGKAIGVDIDPWDAYDNIPEGMQLGHQGEAPSKARLMDDGRVLIAMSRSLVCGEFGDAPPELAAWKYDYYNEIAFYALDCAKGQAEQLYSSAGAMGGLLYDATLSLYETSLWMVLLSYSYADMQFTHKFGTIGSLQ